MRDSTSLQLQGSKRGPVRLTSIGNPLIIGGAYFLAPAHGVNTGIVCGTLDPMGGAINYLSLVVALLKAEK